MSDEAEEYYNNGSEEEEEEEEGELHLFHSYDALAKIEEYSTISQQIISKTVKAMISLNNNRITITTDNVKKIVWDQAASNSGIKFRTAFDSAASYLDSCLGYKLVELPPKILFTPKGNKFSNTKNYMLISNLDDDKTRYVIESEALGQSNRLFQSEMSDERHDYRGDKDLNPTLNSDEKLMNNGIVLLILSIIILSDNSVYQEELLKIIETTYGITEITKFDISQKTLLDFLKDLDKQKYIYRKITKGDNNDQDVIEYSLGRRGQAEFDKDSFIDFARIIMDQNDDDPAFLKMVNDSIKAAYD